MTNSEARKRIQEAAVAIGEALAPLRAVHHDAVNHPQHYTSHPSGVECIEVTEHMGFNLGNAVKYIWRADLKNDALEDLRKAAWYVQREIERRERAARESGGDHRG